MWQDKFTNAKAARTEAEFDELRRQIDSKERPEKILERVNSTAAVLEEFKIANNLLQGTLTPTGAGYRDERPIPVTVTNSPAKPEVIEQAGIAVGKVFGGRRSLTGTTVFEFQEITNSGQFNFNAPFEYQGHTLRMISAESITGLNTSRIQDGRIITHMTAKVLK